MSSCLVNAQDYIKHFGGTGSALKEEPAPVYAGPERRASNSDRRRLVDRRGEICRGRRYKLADRRKRK